MELKLNGPSALLAVVALTAFGGYRMISMQTELETEALEELKIYLANEYAQKDVAALSDALQSTQPVDGKEAEAHVENILTAQKITFPSVSARGMWNTDRDSDVIVKVEIQVDGGPPPDGDSIRYYRMRYRTLSGWRVGMRTSVWSYHLKLF